jgi:hypothetical protein
MLFSSAHAVAHASNSENKLLTAAMKPRHALIALLSFLALLSCVLSVLDARGIAEPRSLQIGSTLAFSVLTFAWFWLDSESRSYERSPFLNVAVVALGFIAVPYYLLRSRPKGERLKAMGKFLAFTLLSIIALFVGSLPALWLGQYA